MLGGLTTSERFPDRASFYKICKRQEKIVNDEERCVEPKKLSFPQVQPEFRPPVKPGCRPKHEASRLWRRKKILGGSKSSGGKASPGISNLDLKKCEEKVKTKKVEPIPMKKRAFPESFWHQPETMQTSSLAGSFHSVLPPLFSSESNNNEDITEIRPLTPPGEKSEAAEKKIGRSRVMMSPPDTALLFSLFDQYESKIDQRLVVKRGRPKKITSDKTIAAASSKREEDPCMVVSLSEKLFPQLSLGGDSPTNIAPKFAVLKLPSGERTVELPAVQNQTNYSAMLNELVSHM